MLRRIDVVPERGSVLVLYFDPNPATGFFVSDIQGLDPVKATMVSSSLGTIDGEQFQSSRRDKRNIVIKLGFDPTSHVIADLRRQLYALFMPKESVRLRFYFDDPEAGYIDIAGKVESFVMPIFTQVPEATISIVCFDPDFYVPTPVLIECQTAPTSNAYLVDYSGTVDTGVILRVQPNRELRAFQLFFQAAGGPSRTMVFDENPVLAGETVEISTVPGNKYVHLRRANGTVVPVLYSLTPTSAWMTLQPGQNYFWIYSEGSPVYYHVTYQTRHGGL